MTNTEAATMMLTEVNKRKGTTSKVCMKNAHVQALFESDIASCNNHAHSSKQKFTVVNKSLQQQTKFTAVN
jgi:hypothetical protein